jgi:hypothetical protein
VDGEQEPWHARQLGGDGGEKPVAFQTMNMHNIRLQSVKLMAQIDNGLQVEA